ncbi:MULTISPECIES: DJ-1/PfpI family protein [Niallia]|jgi:transcriptional regulator GlxA family with amidase domain|uniref:AraC family transcriptional regulator n=1 Tax=Niallia circulans TaxID=1397 RepID=A0A268FH98_NIACI|nr:DJ-1/PfpI family protein [Niallia circulans]AYV66550.1 DJ-1/PfpI family protein [Niallia circulans]AYV70629.1 DJ-1/PfpI family protein [Niallia circulans]NRG26569.1 DJ-1/PfpI family protein [Niallia circulans]PAD84750.1 AraC family transcriptional regulator [Niallia circulans]QJX62438.1 DJ-1/PfpI family protein [Niallia circulans]
MQTDQWKIGIFLFNDVEVLDFAGPFEVFSVTAREDGSKPFIVQTISETGQMIRARNGLKVYPDYSFQTMPKFDLLIIPGGLGAREREVHNKTVINWIKEQMGEVQWMASVCTGALLLAEAGLLDGLNATTHWASLTRLKEEYPQVNVVKKVKFVDEGRIITSGGISAGINMSFHLVKRLAGVKIAKETAKRMEYDVELS